MATGRDMQLTKQVGEYLVAAELSRRGLIATTFSGNVPHFDILVADSLGRSHAVQVKAIKGGSWQFDVRQFLEVTLDGERQVLGSDIASPQQTLTCIFVVIGKYGSDQFFVLDWMDLQRTIVEGYRRYINRKGGVRPRKSDSFHTAVSPKELEKFRDNWQLLEKRLASMAGVPHVADNR